MEGPPSEDLATTVLTCKGDLRDPSFPLVLHKLVCKLEALLKSGKKPFRVTKVEPWNSVRVTFNIPREAAHRLRLLAERGDTALRELGILSVQIEGDQIITLTLASGFGDKQNLVLTNKPATEGASSSSSTSSTSSSGVAVATGVLPAAIAGASGLAVNRDTATPATANCKPGSTTPPLTSATLSCNNSNNTSNNATSTIASSATSSHFPSASASVALRVDSVSLSGSKQQGYAHHSGVVNNILDNLKTKNAQYLSHGPSTSSTFKSPNVIAPQSSGPLPFVTSSSSSTNSTLLSSVASSSPSTNSNSNTSANIVRNVPGPTSTAPNVGPFPFASMQHAMHTKQGTSTSSVHPSSTQQTLLNTTTTTSVVSTTDTLNAAFIRNPNVFNNVVKNSLLTTSTATTTVPTVIKQQAQNVSMAVGHGASCNSVMTVSAAGNVCSGVSSSAIASATTTTTTSSSASSSVALTSPLLVNLLQSDGSGSHLKMMPPPPPPLQPQQTPPVTNATPVVAAATGITLPTPLASTSITGEAVPKRSKQRKPRKVKDKPPDEGTKQGPGIVVVTSLSAPTPVVVTTGVSVAQISNKIQNHPLPSTTTAVSATPTIATTTTTTTTASTTVQPMVQSSVVKSTSQSSKPQSLGVHSHHFINIPTGTMPRYPSIHPEAQGQPQVATSGQLPLRHQQPPLLTTPTVAPTQSQFNHVGSPQVAVPPPPPSPSQSLQRPPALQSMVATLAPSGMNGPQVESLIHQSSTQITRSSPALTTSVAPVVSSSLPPSNALLSTGPQQQQQDGGKTKHLINPFTGHLEPMMSDDEDEDRHSAIDFPELEQGGAVSGLGLGLGSVVPHSRPCEQLIAESLKDNNNHSDTDSGFGKSTTDASSQSPLEISSLDPVTLVDPLPTLSPNSTVCPISSSTTASAVSTGSPPVRFLIPKAGPSGTVSVGSNPGFNIVVKSVMVTNPTPSVKIVSNQEAPAALSTVSSSSLLIPFPSTTSITTTQAEATSSTTTVVDTTSKSLDEKAGEEIVLKENNDIIEEKPEDEQAANILVLNDEVIKDRNNNDGHDSSGTEESDLPNLEPISLSIPAQEHLVSSSEEPLMPDIISGGASNLLIGPSSVTITLGGSPPSNGPSDTEDSMSSNDGKRHSVASGDHNYTSVKSLLKESVDDDETEEVIIEDQEVDEGKTDSESNSMLSPNLVSIVEKTNSRPSKRKSSENAAERIKAYMDYEDVPRKSIYTGINVTPSNSVTSITIRSRSESSEASDLTISNNRGETVTVTPHELNSFATKTSVVKNATPKLRKRKLTTTSNNNNNTTSGTPTEAITVVVDHHSASSEEDESLDDSKSWRNKTRLRQSSTKPESVTGPGRPPSAKAKRNCKDNTKKDVKTKKAPVKRKGREVTNSVTTQRSSTRRTTRDHNNIALPPVAPADESVTTIVVNDTETVEIIEDSEEEIIIPSMPQSTSTNAAAAATTTTTVITTGGSLTNHVFEEATAASPTVVSATNASSGLSLLNKRKTRTIVSNETNDVSCITTTNTTTTTTSKRRKINKDGHR